jgi:signal transduction histidine kinase
MPDAPRFSVVVLGGDNAPPSELIEQSLRGASVRRLGPEYLRQLPVAEALIVTDTATARVARATGFAGHIIICGAPENDDERAAFRAQGAHFAVATDGDADGIAAALPRGPDGSPVPVPADVARTQRLLAAGELAFGLQHALNNPLTALMTEVQLLLMEAPSPEVKAAADRMLDLVRRVAHITRSLDAVRDKPFKLRPS